MLSFAVCRLQNIIDNAHGRISESDENRIQCVIDALKGSSGIGSVTTFPVTHLVGGEVQLDDSKVYIIKRP
ncbi:hypothetical protein FACS189472_06870 [Alphaproteobacteria bacterium]|nr:hypothetical protein FACS189472_06870 [Alphaproteobacteria bacterium]